MIPDILQALQRAGEDHYLTKREPNPDKPEIRNSPNLIKLAEIRNGSTGSPP